MLILFNKYINTIIYTFIYISLLYCLLLRSSPSGVWIPDGWWCLPGGWWCLPGGWWCILASSAAYSQPGTQTGARTLPLVRRRSPLNGSLSGFFFIGYSSICQLFKFSYRMLHAKVFMGENFIKTLFLINYRGYFIIRGTHSTINYSYFLHKTDRKHAENQ